MGPIRRLSNGEVQTDIGRPTNIILFMYSMTCSALYVSVVCFTFVLHGSRSEGSGASLRILGECRLSLNTLLTLM